MVEAHTVDVGHTDQTPISDVLAVVHLINRAAEVQGGWTAVQNKSNRVICC